MNKKMSAGKIALEVGAGLAAAGAAAATGYFFYGSKDAKKNRKIAAKWATDMKKEVLKEAKRLENATPKAFAAMVDSVAKTYQSARSVDAADMKRAAKELKENWEMVQREAKRTARKSIARAKTSAKKVVKKAAAPAKKTVKKRAR
ncbi:MAG: hypothetical protein ACYC48_02610 [Minisyncoccota bacterium]